MGVKKLTAECLPAYPYGMDLPMNASGNTLVRFDWKLNQDSSINSASLDRVFEHVKFNGPRLWPAATSALSQIHDADLRAKVVQRFGYMAKLWRNKRKVEEEAEKKAAEAAEQEAEDGIIAESEAVQSAMTTSAKNARAASVSVKLMKVLMSAYHLIRNSSSGYGNARTPSTKTRSMTRRSLLQPCPPMRMRSTQHPAKPRNMFLVLPTTGVSW
jgi:hypothetical protein